MIPDAFKPAFPPQFVTVNKVGLDGKPFVEVNLLHGSVTLADYFAAQLAGRLLEGASFNDVHDDSLDKVADEVWRVVDSLLRRRPQVTPPEQRNGQLIAGPGSKS